VLQGKTALIMIIIFLVRENRIEQEKNIVIFTASRFPNCFIFSVILHPKSVFKTCSVNVK